MRRMIMRGPAAAKPATGNPGPVTSIAVQGDLTDTTTGTIAPISPPGTVIPLPTNGWVLRINTTGGLTIADPTKLTANITRPGFTTVGGSTTRADVGFGGKLLRRVTPNINTPLLADGTSFLVTIDNMVQGVDTVSSVVLAPGFFTGQTETYTVTNITRADSVVYPKPACRPVTPPFTRFAGSTAAIEFIAMSDWGAFGSPVACVRARWKNGGSYGPWAASSTCARSSWTNGTGRHAALNSGLAEGACSGATYTVNVDVSSAPNSGTAPANRVDVVIVYQAMGWFGDVIFDSEVDGEALTSIGLPTEFGPPVSLPVCIDKAGNHSPIYAWVNRDGTGLTSASTAGISTGTTDPGAGNSYQSEAAALTAARTWNNTPGNRSTQHNTTSGIVILYRDVAGSTALGDSTTAYWQRATMVGFSDGLVPPVFSSASYLSTGTTTLACRRRGVQDDGTTAATSTLWSGVFIWQGLTFDATGLTGTTATINNASGSNGATKGGIAHLGIYIDCDIREEVSNVSRNALVGTAHVWRMEYRCDWGGLGGTIGVAGASGNLSLPSNQYAGIQLAIGCRYSSPTARIVVSPAVIGCWGRNVTFADNNGGSAQLPIVNHATIMGVRVDIDTTASGGASAIGLSYSTGTGQRSCQNIHLANCFVRKWQFVAGNTIRISADDVLFTATNISAKFLGTDAADLTGADRVNASYNERAYIQILKTITMSYIATGSFNAKDEAFNDTGLPSAAASAWAAATTYFRGAFVRDNNATPASRVYYQRLTDGVSGAVEATDLADTSAWVNLGTVGSTAPGAQPRRTGTWRSQNAVRNFGNVAVRSENNDVTFSPGSWLGEVQWRGGRISSTPNFANYYRQRTGGTDGATFASWGDYRPKSIAAGDGADSPLLNSVVNNSVVTNMLPYPIDLGGNARRSDGTGAAGAYERVA